MNRLEKLNELEREIKKLKIRLDALENLRIDEYEEWKTNG